MTDYVMKPEIYRELEITSSTTKQDVESFLGNLSNGSVRIYFDSDLLVFLVDGTTHGGMIPFRAEVSSGQFLRISVTPQGATKEVTGTSYSLSTEQAFEPA